MKVKLLTSRAGVNFSQLAGEEIDVTDEEGMRLIKAGQADPVEKRIETATTKKPVQKRDKS